MEFYGIEKVNFHRAIDDTKALYQVTQAMRKDRDDLKEYLNVFGYNPKWGISGIEFKFIRYEAQPYHNMGEKWPYSEILPNKISKN